MSVQAVRLAPPHSLLFVMDDRVGRVPDDTSAAPVVATLSCVTVGTLSEMDGETEVRMSGPEDWTPRPDLSLAWAGRIRTAGVLEVSTSDASIVLEMPVPDSHAPAVDVWTNDSDQPDLVWIVVSQSPPTTRVPRLLSQVIGRIMERNRR